MEEISPAPPPPHTPAFQPVVPVVENDNEPGYWNWTRIGFAVLLIVILWAGTQSDGRIPPGVRQKEARVMAVAIRDSVEQFLADYGRLPVPEKAGNREEDTDSDTSSIEGLATILIGTESGTTPRQNLQGVDYLEGIKPAKLSEKAGTPHAWSNGLIIDDKGINWYSIVDSWGNIFRVRLDADGDGFVENPDLNGVAEGLTKVKQRVIVWSPGEDGKEETWTDNPKSWD
jgi:hypothetical protein